MVVYIDIVFLENFLINYVIIFGTLLIRKNKINNLRCIFSAIIGSIYACITCVNEILFLQTFLFKTLMSFVMVFIAYNPQNIKELCKTTLLFYLITFVFGGTILALLYIISPKNITIINGILYCSYSLKSMIIGCLIAFVLIQICFKYNKKFIQKKDLTCELEIGFKEKKTKILAFIDSGNTLLEPITNYPVIIVNNLKIKKFIDSIKKDITTQIRLIPYKTIGHQDGFIYGFQPDFINIFFEDQKIYLNKIVVGIYNNKFSNNYSALIGINLLQPNK